MKHKKILLIVFFLTLFVFQQVQAGGTIPFTENPSRINVAPSNTAILFSTVYVYVYKLDSTGALPISPELCAWPLDFGVYGCGYDFPASPQDPKGFLYVDVEQDYLPDVLAAEMNLAEIPPDPEALKAQAVASRTVASWKTFWSPWTVETKPDGSEFKTINNSTGYQVFIPGAYNAYPNYQTDIDVALNTTQGQYLSAGNGRTIDAEFGADMKLRTGDGDLVSAPYLKGIEDPISTERCFRDVGNNQYGMSQRGAIRWAKGNTCPDGSGVAWPVKWDYRQILAHYYTGIDLADDSTGNKIAPDDRWNLLWQNNFGSPAGTTPELSAGQTYSIQLRLQNTSVSKWNAGDIELGYHWGDQNWRVVGGNFPEIPAGEEFPKISTNPDPITVANIVAPSTSGNYILYLDLRYRDGNWFSDAGWPDAEIPVQVIAPTPTPTATLANACLLPTATPLPTGATVGILTCTDVNKGGTCSGSGTDHLRFSYSGIDGAMNVAFEVSPLNQNLQLTVIISFQHTEYYVYGQNRANDTLVFAVPIGMTGFENKVGWCYGPQGFYSTCNATFGQTGTVNVGIGKYSITTRPAPDWPASTTKLEYNVDVYGKAVCTQYGTSVPTPTGSPLATPTVTIAPTFTPTPIPTLTPIPQPTSTCSWESWFFCPDGTNSQANSRQAAFSQTNSLQEVALDIRLFYRVRDELLNSTLRGKTYIDLYYRYGPEVNDLVSADPDLYRELLALLEYWEPKLQALLDGQGNTVSITQQEVDAVESFLFDLESVASSDLQSAIANQMSETNLQALVGKTMDQAWGYLNGYNLTWLPPISTANPYRAETGRTVPVEFTLTDLQGNFVVDRSVILNVVDANGNVVAGPIKISDNPTSGLVVQENKYHYNFKTTGLVDGLYTIQVSFNSSNSGQPSVYNLQLIAGKKK